MSETSHRHWNYRAIHFEHGEDSHVAIHEVHYRDGIPVAYSETPAVVLWSVEEPDGTGLAILDRMREALVKPVLRDSEFQASGRKLRHLPSLHLKVPENFDDPLPEEVLQTFEAPLDTVLRASNEDDAEIEKEKAAPGAPTMPRTT